MGLKATGSYLSRTLSYDGAEFSIARVEIDPIFGCVLQYCLQVLTNSSGLVQTAAPFACLPACPSPGTPFVSNAG